VAGVVGDAGEGALEALLADPAHQPVGISRLALTAGSVSMKALPQDWHRQRRVST
jgi:hypothetical protein